MSVMRQSVHGAGSLVTSTGAPVSVATSEAWTDKNSGERREHTEWHRVVVHNKLAEICAQYLTKGSKVFIEGSLKTRQWEDQNGVQRYSTEVVATEVQFIETKEKQQEAPKQGGYQAQKQKPKGYAR